MNYQLIVEEIIEAMDALSTPERRKSTDRFLSTSQQVMGVSNPDMKEVIKALREKYAGWTAREWIDLCKVLVKQGIFECLIVAYELIGRAMGEAG